MNVGQMNMLQICAGHFDMFVSMKLTTQIKKAPCIKTKPIHILNMKRT